MSQQNNQQQERKKRPKTLKPYEITAWEILTKKGVDYNEWKKEQLEKQQFDLLKGKNTPLENLIVEKVCNELVEKELPKILEKMR
ncbi:DUF5415 family protein [Vagococcus fluvialis]|uniref:DUF5415 family protein n=1 Tax=Vagococcus fluvialis TaxID=2738 RepID=A0A7X6DB40_9ENTE|nr:DUF5415 family protein [Vagococcus fluvialis]NKC69062.1 DUF5415 family protein [Vagococcus fluvialis]